MEKRTLLFVIIGIVIFAFAFIILAILVSELKLKEENKFELPEFLNSSSCPEDMNHLPLVLISLDGFRHDYLDRGVTPTLNMLKEKGATAPYMIPSYPSITFPNHYAIVTGLYPESHGIVNNVFRDPKYNETFVYTKVPNNVSTWWYGEPIWNTVQKFGLKSGTFFWPGSDVPIGGMLPNYWHKYNPKIGFQDRIDQILKWLNLKAPERPSFLTLYFNEPDYTGHKEGPESDKVNKKLQEIDVLIRQLIESLIQQELLHCVNLIFISDHGMASGSNDKLIRLKDYIKENTDKVDLNKPGAFAMLSLEKEHKDLTNKLEKNLSCFTKNVDVYRKENLPLRLHFTYNRRIMDYIFKPHEGYSVALETKSIKKGIHGYDNHVKSMNGLFIAYGPSIKPGTKIEPFQNIELYNLMCGMLGVKPASNNGTDGILYGILKEHPSYKKSQLKKPESLDLPDDDTIDKRLKNSLCNTTSGNFQEIKNLFNFTAKMKLLMEGVHLPWGSPRHLYNDELDIKLLHHFDYIAGYSNALKMPLWASFSINHKPSEAEDFYWIPDVRLKEENSYSCETINNNINLPTKYTVQPLFLPEFVKNETQQKIPYLISNLVPFTNEMKNKWKDLVLKTIPNRLENSASPLNLILGPIFDKDSNGILDNVELMINSSKIPSHMFAIVTRCTSKVEKLILCPEKNLDSFGFVLPLKIKIDNCLGNEEFFLDYSAKIRDIEKVSGLEFFHQISIQNRLQIILRYHNSMWAHLATFQGAPFEKHWHKGLISYSKDILSLTTKKRIRF